ncbi:MAG TPA: pyridoxal phosphate-dependent aminotransferase [Candidatus Scatomonas merdavium]|nr:pyridoxal phosphate-dependent aminotransferase [Candidatus Scatomonas merdavium]
MISETMCGLGKESSVIRAIFEYGRKRAAEIGAENVFDFSLGNPNVPVPEDVKKAMKELLDCGDDVWLHGYTSGNGDAETRKAIAEDLNRRFGTVFRPENLYMTCGAAASLKICITALCEPGDEFITFTPFFPEYRVFVETAGAKLVAVSTDPDTFQIDFDRLAEGVSEHTKALIVNSPNNPSGVVFQEEAIRKLAAFLEEKEKEYGHPIWIIADEPYRELVYDNSLKVPYLTKYYRNTLVCYSYSKSLSMPGERIGYILVPDEAEKAGDVYAAVCGAGRALGYVCAPSFIQHVIARCTGQVSDLGVYRKNRDLLYQALTDYGYSCVYPDGAFYLFVKALEEDASAFCERAKKHELLLVPSDDFGTPGYVRIAYCVTTDQITRSLPAFRALAKEYGK